MNAKNRGFSLIDVMVSLVVVAVLISILMPSIGSVRESTRRVVCSSNVRQMMLGIIMYADDNRDYLPPTQFAALAGANASLQDTMEVRPDSSWDGLGLLFVDYLPAPRVFYCPSHWGDHPYRRYSGRWFNDGGSIVSNYSYRGYETAMEQRLNMITPPTKALVADGMRTQSDYSHRVGTNVMRADLSVKWVNDGGELMGLLPQSEDDAATSPAIADAWSLLDGLTEPGGGGG